MTRVSQVALAVASPIPLNTLGLLICHIRPRIHADMTHRKEVFKSKVLQKLYPPLHPPQLETDPSPPCIGEVLPKKAHVKRKALQTGDSGTAKPGRRLYTVLPPPADYPQQSVTLPQLESIKSVKNPAEEEVDECSEDLDQDEEAKGQKRRRRRRKKTRLTADGDSGKGEVNPQRESGQSPVEERGERLSMNKRRKLKKKRHKEKLLSLGLMPRASALEFTFQKDDDLQEEEEDDEKRAAEVLDFLKTTMEIYVSDSSSDTDRLPRLSGTLDDLLSSIASGSRPASLVKQLHTLKTLVQQQETEALWKALEDIRGNTPLTAEETTAVVSLFQYWITEILPMQRDKQTGHSAIHP